MKNNEHTHTHSNFEKWYIEYLFSFILKKNQICIKQLTIIILFQLKYTYEKWHKIL